MSLAFFNAKRRAAVKAAQALEPEKVTVKVEPQEEIPAAKPEVKPATAPRIKKGKK